MSKLKPIAVRRKRVVLASELRRLKEAFHAACTAHKLKEKALMERCPHEDIQFFPDGAGGFNSFYQCDDCGKRDPRRERIEEASDEA